MKLVRLILTVVLVLCGLILEDQVAHAQLVWNPTIFAPAINPPGGANNYGPAIGQGGGIFTGPTPPANPTEGMLWYDNSTTPQVLKIWNGTTWELVSSQTPENSGPTPPLNPTVGQLWYDTSTTPATMRFWDGTTWVTVHAGVFDSPTFAGTVTMPDSTTWNTTTLQFATTTTIVGPDGSTWTSQGINNLHSLNIAAGGAITFNGVPMGGTCPAGEVVFSISPTVQPTCVPVTGGATISATPPPTPTNGMLWWDSVSAQLFVWNGSAWVIAVNLVGNFSGVGSCTAGQFVTRLNAGAPPTCAAISSLPSGVTITSPTFSGTITLPDGSTWSSTGINMPPSSKITVGIVDITGTAPALTFGGVAIGGGCPADQFVNYISNKGVPSCGTPAGTGAGGGGEYAPLNNPANGQNNYAPINNPAFVGTLTLNGQSLASTANPTFSGTTTITNLTVSGTVSLPSASVTDAMLSGAYSGVGACSANQFVNALHRNAAPTCAAVSLTGVTISNPTFSGTITLPDGSTWGAAGLSLAAGSRAATLDSLTGSGGTSTGALTRSSGGAWSLTTYASSNNPTFTGTVSFPNGSINDAALANAYSGTGTCTANQYVTALNRNAAPTCGAPTLTGYLPINNPTFTGTMTGNYYTINQSAQIYGNLGNGILWNNAAAIGMGGGWTGTYSTAFALNLGSNMYFTGGLQTPNTQWTTIGDFKTAGSVQVMGPAVIITGNTGLSGANVKFMPTQLFSISPVAFTSDPKHSNSAIIAGAAFRVTPVQIAYDTNGFTSLDIYNMTTGTGAAEGVWLHSNMGDWGGMQMTNTSWTTDGNPARSFYVGTNAANGMFIRNEIGPITISAAGYASRFRVIPNTLAGLDLPGYGGIDLPDYGVAALHMGGAYFKAGYWATMTISLASFQTPQGTWIRDGGAGSGTNMLQLGPGSSAYLFYGAPNVAGTQVQWWPNMTWADGTAKVNHLDNNQDYGVPVVWGCGGAALMAGSRDSFGEVWCPEASQDMGMNFSRPFVGNSICVFSDDGQPLIWFPYNKSASGTLVQCRNMGGPAPDYCWGGQWMIYHCAGAGG